MRRGTRAIACLSRATASSSSARRAPPADHLAKYDIQTERVGTDPALTMTTRRAALIAFLKTR